VWAKNTAVSQLPLALGGLESTAPEGHRRAQQPTSTHDGAKGEQSQRALGGIAHSAGKGQRAQGHTARSGTKRAKKRVTGRHIAHVFSVACVGHTHQHEAEITAILQELSRTPITLALLQVSGTATYTALWTSASQKRGAGFDSALRPVSSVSLRLKKLRKPKLV
jgi:hypothetical protein